MRLDYIYHRRYDEPPGKQQEYLFTEKRVTIGLEEDEFADTILISVLLCTYYIT
jgi:hypothetical protein